MSLVISIRRILPLTTYAPLCQGIHTVCGRTVCQGIHMVCGRTLQLTTCSAWRSASPLRASVHLQEAVPRGVDNLSRNSRLLVHQMPARAITYLLLGMECYVVLMLGVMPVDMLQARLARRMIRFMLAITAKEPLRPPVGTAAPQNILKIFGPLFMPAFQSLNLS